MSYHLSGRTLCTVTAARAANSPAHENASRHTVSRIAALPGISLFRLSRAAVLCACIALAMPVAAAAQELVTDRPDQTESTAVVPRGYLQLETGAVVAGDDGETVTSLPGTLFRYGLTDILEVRAGFSGWVIDSAADETGFADSELSMKLRLADERGWMPDTAVLAGVSVPTGEDGFTSDAFDPWVRMAFSHSLPGRYALGYNIAWKRVTVPMPGADDTYDFMPYSCSLGIGVTDALGAFVEVYGEAALEDGADSATLLDGGFTYLLTDSIQLDIEGGAGLTEDAGDWFAGAGFTIRLPE